jgi:hypothetical protein
LTARQPEARVPSRREIERYEAHEAAAGWRAMSLLIRHVTEGGMPRPAPPTILPRPGEAQYGTLQVDSEIHCGMDVEYSSGMYASGGLLFTAASLAVSSAVNANNRRRAEALSRPQWRPWGRFPAIVTNQRLLLMTEQWSSYDFNRLVMLEPFPQNWSVALHYEGSYPMRLRGPWVPWMTVVICATRFNQPWPPGYVPPPHVQQFQQVQRQALPATPPADQPPQRPALPPAH